jgi:hypothetical protein
VLRFSVNRSIALACSLGAVVLVVAVVASTTLGADPSKPDPNNGGAVSWVAIDSGERGTLVDNLVKDVEILNTGKKKNAFEVTYHNDRIRTICKGTLNPGAMQKCTVPIHVTGSQVIIANGYFQAIATYPVVMSGSRQEPIRTWTEVSGDRAPDGPGVIQQVPYDWRQGCPATTPKCPGSPTAPPPASQG